MSRLGCSVLAVCQGFVSTLCWAADPVGGVDFKRGPVAAILDPAGQRELVIGSEVYRGDEVVAGAQAFAIIRFEDDNKLAVRPNTRVTVASYLRQADGDVARVKLEQGGIRANIRSREGVRRTYHIQAGATEVAVDEAQFDLRHCGEDCVNEAKLLNAEGVPLPADAAGRVAMMRGESWAVTGDEKRRVLTLAAPVFNRDRLQTGSRGVLLVVLRDGGRISLEPNSELELKQMPVADNRLQQAGMKLVTGGMRALTGALAHERPERFSVETPVATTGIRGTGFDLICEGSCVNAAASGAAPDPDAAALPEGLYSSVWKGAIFQRNEAGSFDLVEGEQQYIANSTSSPKKMQQPTQNLQRMQSPRPDGPDQGDFEDFVDASESLLSRPLPGLYAHVYNGSLMLLSPGGEAVTLQAGHTAHVGSDGTITTIVGAPGFMAYDEACVGC